MRTLLRLIKCLWSVGNLFVLLFFLKLLVYYVQTGDKTTCRHAAHKNHNIIYKYQVYSQSSDVKVSQEPLNWIPFYYLAEPYFCSYGTHLRYLFVIHSDQVDFKERDFLRRHVFTQENSYRHGFRHMFVTGISKMGNSSKLLNEAKIYEDMLVVNITENYHNITHKTRAWISWIHDNCPNLGYTHIIKVDDDVMINLESLMELLDEVHNHKKMILCRILPEGLVVRNNESKWYLSHEEYAQTTLGLYCQGMAYILTSDLIEVMYTNLRRVQYLWMDDWYVTHGLVYNAQAIYLDISPHVFPIESLPMLYHAIRTAHVNVDYRPMFGHFRPKIKFTLENRAGNWSKLVKRYDCG